MKHKKREKAECSVCGKKRRIFRKDDYGLVGHGLRWCRLCSIREQCVSIVCSVPESALVELVEALEPLKRLSPDDEAGGLTAKNRAATRG